MNRRHHFFDIGGDRCSATLDDAEGTTGFLIVSGGNEIRSGAHGGQAAMAQYFAALGHPVLRYDRRGIGDSEGDNGGFENSADDIAAAAALFRANNPALTRLIAFGNCDAASALCLFHAGQFDALILANPWIFDPVVEPVSGASEAPAKPSAAAIRARYWARIKNPRSIIDLLSGKIDLAKLLRGLTKAAVKEGTPLLAKRMGGALAGAAVPVHIILAARDGTALAFKAAWDDAAFDTARGRVTLSSIDSASHSFAGGDAQSQLFAKIAAILSA